MELNYNIKGTGLGVSDEIRAYVEKRLAHVEKFVGSDPSAHLDVELHFQASEEGKRYRAEYTLAVAGDVFRAEERGDALTEAIDLADAELSRELGRAKERKEHNQRRSGSKFKDFIRGFGRKH
jgi:ribosomal subunit interface protein